MEVESSCPSKRSIHMLRQLQGQSMRLLASLEHNIIALNKILSTIIHTPRKGNLKQKIIT